LRVLTALVLICSVAVTPNPEDCTRNNATTVMRVPAEFGNPARCFMYAQAYLAGTSIGRELDANERVKVICVRSENDRRIPPASGWAQSGRRSSP
jgi:hypothetical protein